MHTVGDITIRDYRAHDSHRGVDDNGLVLWIFRCKCARKAICWYRTSMCMVGWLVGWLVAMSGPWSPYGDIIAELIVLVAFTVRSGSEE
jgi:hypothetical protein